MTRYTFWYLSGTLRYLEPYEEFEWLEPKSVTVEAQSEDEALKIAKLVVKNDQT